MKILEYYIREERIIQCIEKNLTKQFDFQIHSILKCLYVALVLNVDNYPIIKNRYFF